MGIPDYGPCGTCGRSGNLMPCLHCVVNVKNAEIARLRAEVERQARALKAGPAALRAETKVCFPAWRPFYESLAVLVEAAQEKALAGQ